MSNQTLSSALMKEIQAQYPEGTEIIGEGLQQALLVDSTILLEILQVLKTKDSCPFSMLRNLTAVDYIEYLEVVYHLYSLSHRQAMTIRTRCASENSEVPSVTSLWPSANFQEREVYDLLGVTFTGHPDLRRILMPEEFTEHPLRKSFKTGARNTTGEKR